jgi:steroid delta-isomerase-like uncharacterized protein
MATTTQTPSEIAREMFRALFEDRDLSDPSRYWTDDSIDYFLGAGKSARGKEALTQWFRDLFAAVPDWKVDIENVFDDGDRQVVVQWHATGTFDGSAPFLGIEPNGRRIDMRAVDVFKLDADGKVDTNTVYYDGADFARQLGMLPPQDSAADRAMLAAFNGLTKLKRRLKRA